MKTTKKTVRGWAWVFTDGLDKNPIISIDETKAIVSQEKRELLSGKNYPYQDAKSLDHYRKLMRSIYQKSTVVPVLITYELPVKKK